MTDRVNRYLFDENGRARMRRMVITAGALIFMAMFGTAFLVVMELFVNNPPLAEAWLVFVVIVLKLPLIAFCWWLIARNKEIPGVPVVWSDQEVRDILRYLTVQARESMDRPDAGARLAYLSREAWHVADQAEGTLKADAVGVALEIDRLSARHGGRRVI
jgi:hypothetical protein